MPRNIAKPLDQHRAARAYRLQDWLKGQSQEVTLRYIKRNGQFSASTGIVGEFSGREGMDTMSVTLFTSDKGPRTINLDRVVKAIPSKEVR